MVEPKARRADSVGIERRWRDGRAIQHRCACRGLTLPFLVAVVGFAPVGAIAASRDTQSDTWVATDALGRRVAPPADRAPGPRPQRYVGVFYFLWFRAEEQQGLFDVTRILRNDPDAMKKPTSPPWGPLHAPHHWGEPLFGYYLNDDEWVLRKHAQMLSDAGIDVIIFDTSNKVTYPHNYLALLKVFHQVREEGNRAPDVAFLTPFWDPASTVKKLHDELYSKGLYSDLWFRWDGKPLILADPSKVGPAFRDFFTFRTPQPDYFLGPTKPDMWSWLEVYPQHMFRNSRGENEQMSVGVAQNAIGNRLGTMSEAGARGRSCHNGSPATQPGSVLYGHNFAEQFERAIELDPQFIFVTGWNEWFAGRFDEFAGVRQPVMFVDQFDQEHSRDIEPMKGGHGDNYYYQLVSYVRRFKGARRAPVAGGPKTIDVAGDFSQWSAVAPEYLDDVGDIAHRDHAGFSTSTRYVNTSGRNDIVLCKVAYDSEHLYFYARTRAPLTPCSDPNWMTLFLNTGRDPSVGWHGYSFVINHRIKGPTRTTLEYTRTGWNWQHIAELPLHIEGDQFMLAVPRKRVDLSDPAKPLQFEFKWADNCSPDGDINAFTLTGDAAPNCRFSYLFGVR